MKPLACAALVFLLPPRAHAAESFDRIAFSAFGKLDAAKIDELAKGDVFTATNTAMKFPRGISSQACFMVSAPPATVAHLLENENPTARPELEVYQYRAFHDATEAQFDSLRLDPKIDPVRKLLSAMAKPDDLQVSSAERQKVIAAAKDPKSAAAFWAGVLKSRFEAFRTGGAAALPETVADGRKLSAQAELRAVLAEEPALADRFAELLNDTAIVKPAIAIPPLYYWSISNVNKLAAIDFGVMHSHDAGDHWQMIDADVYVSSGYLASLTLYELWPVTHAGKARTLVWQADLVSATGLAGGFGVKRKIASLLIQNDLKTAAHALQEDAAKAH